MKRTRFIPTFSAVAKFLGHSSDTLKRDQYVTVSTATLRTFIRMALLSDAKVDVNWYRDTYRETHLGRIADPAGHYKEIGYFDDLAPHASFVDETYYLAANPDVPSALKSGRFSSLTEHYIEAGCADGRAPSADQVEEAANWQAAFTAYGSPQPPGDGSGGLRGWWKSKAK